LAFETFPYRWEISPYKPGSEREEALFAAALQRPSSERAAFLDGACHGDPALRARLEALLAANEQPNELLGDDAAPAEGAAPTMKIEFVEEPADEVIGQKIRRYKLLERVGEGGCGVVYVAEQTEPVRRRVALKVIKLGMDTKQVVARFEAERQEKQRLDFGPRHHPRINHGGASRLHELERQRILRDPECQAL
jgi:eukaryotic-like serine/threonine-protein kinase